METDSHLLNRPGLHSIKMRVILMFGIITALMAAGMTRLAYVSVRDIYLRQLTEQTERLSRLAAAQIDVRFLDFIEPGGAQSPGLTHYRKEVRRIAERLFLNDVFIFNAQGKVLVNAEGTLNASAGVALYLNQLQNLPQNGSFHSLPFKARDGQWYFWNFLRLTPRYFLGVRERSEKLAELDALARLFWGIGLLGVFLVVLAGWFVGRSITRPVNKLIAFSAEIGQGNLQAEAPGEIRGELAQLNAALQTMQRNLKRQEEEKEEILAQIAHELRNPLGGISLLAGLITEDPAAGSMVREYAQTISRETEGLKHQIGAYLHYSRPQPAQPEPIDVPDFFAEAAERFSLRPEAARIRLSINSEPADFEFDPTHLRQILWNLIENSIRSGADEIELGNNGSRLYVRDNGRGIAADHLAHIFEPFFTTEPEGTGLGLAVCRKLCRANNAEIRAANNPVTGCTFSIWKQQR